jgi:hypothetical protein
LNNRNVLFSGKKYLGLDDIPKFHSGGGEYFPDVFKNSFRLLYNVIGTYDMALGILGYLASSEKKIGSGKGYQYAVAVCLFCWRGTFRLEGTNAQWASTAFARATVLFVFLHKNLVLVIFFSSAHHPLK